MAELTSLEFKGLFGLVDNNLIPVTQALYADNCYLDTAAISGRNGYRSATGSPLVNASTPQFVGRFRPTATTAKTIAVVNGEIVLVTDPSSESTSDGTAAVLGTPFGATDTISGAQLNGTYYLGSSNAATPFQQINSSFALNSIAPIPAVTPPTSFTQEQFAWKTFKSFSPSPTVSGCHVNTAPGTYLPNMNSAWVGITASATADDDPPIGAYIYYNTLNALSEPINATGMGWLAVAVSPHTNAPGTGSPPPVGDYPVSIQVAVDNAGVPGAWQQVASIYDTSNQSGSPNAILIDVSGLDPAVKSAISWMRFILTDSTGQTSGGKFILYGYMFLPTGTGDTAPFDYYFDLYDPVSGSQGPLSVAFPVTPAIPSIPAYPDSFMDSGEPNSVAGQNDTLLGANDARVFNTTAPTPYPSLADIVPHISFSVTVPTFTGYSGLTLRLWRDTASGRRLCATQTVGSGGTYAITDNAGVQLLQAQQYTVGGTAPAMTTLTARQDRLVAGSGQTVYISSFTPSNAGMQLVPEWPPIALINADGWNFDVSSSPLEQIQAVDGTGDALYIFTQEACYSMVALDPDSQVYTVIRKGALGGQACCYALDSMFYMAYDGIYRVWNASSWEDISEPVKYLYLNWLQPDQNAVVFYQYRHIYFCQGNRYLRHDFITKTWTRGTLADSVFSVASWLGSIPSPTVEQSYLLTGTCKLCRWQPGATLDDEGGANNIIPDWVYSTGFNLFSLPAIIKGVMVDCSDDIVVTVAKTVAGNAPEEGRTLMAQKAYPQDEVWYPVAADFRAYKMRFQFSASNAVTLRRAMYEQELIDARGG